MATSDALPTALWDPGVARILVQGYTFSGMVYRADNVGTKGS